MAPRNATSSSIAEVRPMRLKKPIVEPPAPRMGMKYTGSFLGDNFNDWPLYKRLNWLHVPLLTITPILAFYGLFTAPFEWRTYVWAFVYYVISGIGITAGYHRLFAHRCYEATPFLRAMLMLMGSGAVEGSVRWWSRDHRAHHRYVDTDYDPYSANKGFWYAHWGWMMVKQDPKKIGKADISDLNNDPIIRWQHRNYLWLAIIMGLVIPTVVAGLCWGDYYGGFFIAGIARLVFVHHSTFCINSVAHYIGSATYTDQHTARNSWITALVTVGEGYHNFHHEFPNDYRNGVEWYQYDPTKWAIWVFEKLGMAYNLRRFSSNEIKKGEYQMEMKAVKAKMGELNWGPDADSLPLWSTADIQAKVAAGEKLLILDGFVVDVKHFVAEHPGGEALLRTEFGNDVTTKFRGEYYNHSNAAKNLSATFRVARVQGYWE